MSGQVPLSHDFLSRSFDFITKRHAQLLFQYKYSGFTKNQANPALRTTAQPNNTIAKFTGTYATILPQFSLGMQAFSSLFYEIFSALEAVQFSRVGHVRKNHPAMVDAVEAPRPSRAHKKSTI